MTNHERDEQYDVVWSGEEGLTGDRETRPTETWESTPRSYTWTGRYSKKAKCTCYPWDGVHAVDCPVNKTTQPSNEIFNPLTED